MRYFKTSDTNVIQDIQNHKTKSRVVTNISSVRPAHLIFKFSVLQNITSTSMKMRTTLCKVRCYICTSSPVTRLLLVFPPAQPPENQACFRFEKNILNITSIKGKRQFLGILSPMCSCTMKLRHIVLAWTKQHLSHSQSQN